VAPPVLAADATNITPLLPIAAGAVVAVLGYVGKLIVESWQQWRTRQAALQAQLRRLQALLKASRAAFQVQAAVRDRLAADLTERLRSDLPQYEGYEGLFSLLYDRMTPGERSLHEIIRAYTEFALRPINQAMLGWLDADVHYRGLTRGRGAEIGLPSLLNALDVHLRLWLAKYEAWLPKHPQHALVYLEDEQRHGVGFPSGLDEAVADLVGSWSNGIKHSGEFPQVSGGGG
jgi:hypothetical protein